MDRLTLHRAGSVVRVRTAVVLAGVCSLAAYCAGWAYWQPKAPAPVVATQAQPIPGGLRLGNTPAKPGEAPKPAHRVAAGRKVDAVARVRLEPRPVQGAPAGCECKTIDLELVTSHGRDGQPVAEAFTDDAKVTAGTFTTPAMLPVLPPARPWVVAGGLGAPVGKGGAGTGSLLLGRELGPLWVGGQATYNADTGAAVFVHAGFRF